MDNERYEIHSGFDYGHGQAPVTHRDKPGMDRTARESVGRWLGMALGLLLLTIILGATCGLVWLFKTNQDDSLRVVLAAVVFAAACLFASLATGRTKPGSRYGAGTRVICGIGAAFAFLLSIVQVLAVVG